MHVCLEFLTIWLHLPILAVQLGALDSGHDFELACFFLFLHLQLADTIDTVFCFGMLKPVLLYSVQYRRIPFKVG